MSHQKNRRQQNLKHQIFLDYAKIEVTPHWRQFFENCAYGVFHKGISYKDGVLYHKKQKKKPSNLLIPGDTIQAVESIKRFIRNELGEISMDELTRKRAELDVALKENTLPPDIQWKDIRAPTVKQHLIAMFVSKMKDEFSLTPEEVASLNSVLNGGIASKLIGSEDIVLENHKIVSIEGFDYDGEGFYLTRTPPEVPKVTRKTSVSKKGQTNSYVGWDKKVAAYTEFLGISVK